jgi:alpha-amylase/alpha-mannosidase (GH57 family)
MNRFGGATTFVVAAVLAMAATAYALPEAVDGGVRFTVDAPDARTVHLAGEFNAWDPTALPMTDEDGDGVWEVMVELQTGRSYQYKFVIDGGAEWRPDPDNPERVDDNYGGYNTVMSVTMDGDVVLGALEGPEVFEPVVASLESRGRPLALALVWHQHQPKYLKDLETGEYHEPWVRLHAIKDYYDMAAILRDYPDIHFTINLTPVLLTQLSDIIEGYDTGGATDRYLRMTLKDAADLTLDDKVFLLTHFFNAHWDNMIYVWPRYGELKDMKGGDTRSELEAAAATFSEQDWRDLQAWFNLAWFDPDFQEGDVVLPDGAVVTVKHLIEKERGYTEADKKEIIETQMAVCRNVVAVHRELQNEGQLEVITTPFYHPILPLLVDTELAKVAMPGLVLPEGLFSYPEDAERQVVMAVDYYEQLFGMPPAGLWPAEGAVAQEIVGIVAGAGLRWMASDDQVLQRSLGERPLTDRQRYQMYRVEDGGEEMAMIFRDHRLSDDIGFNFGKMDGVEAANHMMRSLHAIHTKLASDDRTYVVPIILDGENAWEWYRHDGKEFFHSWYDQMSRADWLDVVTVSEYLEANEPVETIGRLWAGSWINQDFSTWIGEAEENAAWRYLATVREDLGVYADGASPDDDAVDRAFGEIYAAEGSDWFWWYGTDQTSSLEEDFDRIYRETLANVYRLIGAEPPQMLEQPILMKRPSVASGPASGVMARGEAELLAGPVMTDEGVLLSHRAAGAGSVHLAGEFNGWSTTATPMSDDDGDGIWTVVVKDIEPGSYQYKFVLDGGVWEPDAGNPESVPDPYGGQNSLLVIE